MKININFKNGRWLVNNKKLAEMNPQERLFMDSFFKEVKIKSIKMENYLFSNANQRL